jgi:hypothetical protein
MQLFFATCSNFALDQHLFRALTYIYASIRKGGWPSSIGPVVPSGTLVQGKITMIKRAVMATLLGLSLITPALAGDLEDDIAELAAAEATLDADKATYKSDKDAHASKAVLDADKAAIKTVQALIKALKHDIKADQNEIKDGASPH